MKNIWLLLLAGFLVLAGCIEQEDTDSDLVKLQNSSHRVVQTENNLILKEFYGNLEGAAQSLQEATCKKMVITSASRSLRKQAELFYDNCLANPDRQCNPVTCDITKGAVFSRDGNGGYVPKGELEEVGMNDREKVIDVLVANGKPENCPHTSYVAVDAWCEGTVGKQADVACQQKLTEEMVQQGFCRLDKEAWHFEWAAKSLSRNCLPDANASYWVGSRLIDPTIDGRTGKECAVWDYGTHRCVRTKSPLDSEEKTCKNTDSLETIIRNILPPPIPQCRSGYVVGNDNACHQECGRGTYCLGDSRCYNNQCLVCDAGYYLGSDGRCYSENDLEPICPAGYVYGQDGVCHEECGSEMYCTGDSQCYNNQCLSCPRGYYLATDGRCYSESTEEYLCPQGYVLGEDYFCHEECGSNTYCMGDSACYNNQCLVCDAGYYLGTDGRCYQEEGGALECPSGYVLGQDDWCHEECGTDTYCMGNAQCINGQCLTCDPGYYLATDGYCYPENGGTLECPSGYVLGNDDLCHPECGSGTYCIGNAQCYNGQCLSCDPGYYLGTDGRCYPEGGTAYCDPGYVLGNDDLCHPECGSGTYCIGNAQCYNGQCLSCDPGYYLGTDGRCYPEGGGGGGAYCDPGYILGQDGWCHPECGYNTYCTGNSVCYNGQCLGCNPGYYLGTDGRCYPEGGSTWECQPGYYDVGGGTCCPNGYYYATDGYCYPY